MRGGVGSQSENAVFTGLGQDEEEQHGKCYQLLIANLFSTSSSLTEPSFYLRQGYIWPPSNKPLLTILFIFFSNLPAARVRMGISSGR